MLSFIHVCESAVDLIREDVKVVFPDDRCNRPEILSCHDRARRIVRIGQHQNFGLRRDCLLECLRREAEFILFRQPDDDRLCIRQDRAWLVRNIRRLRDQDLVAGIDHRPEHEIDRLGSADSDENFLHRIIGKPLVTFQFLRNRFPELLKAGIRRVKRASLLE